MTGAGDYIEARQDEAIQIHGLLLGVDDLMDLIQAEPSNALAGVRSILAVAIEKADDLQRKLDRVNLPKA